MPLWGIGEYRSANLSHGRTTDETGLVDTRIGDPNICEHPDQIHNTLFLHQEAPVWLENRGLRDLNDFENGHTTSSTTGPANTTHAGTPDSMGDAVLLEQNIGPANDLNQCIGRGFDSYTGIVDTSLRGTQKKTHLRLIDGGRGNGYHYEYQYIDTNGNHRRRFVHLVATRKDLTNQLGHSTGASSSLEWRRTYTPSGEEA